MRRYFLFFYFLLFALFLNAKTFQPEELKYNVMFRWGLLNKKAGSAVLKLNYGPNSYMTQLTAASEPWADKIYRVRDTLNGSMDYGNMMPIYYEKIANEGADRKYETVTYDYTKEPVITAYCTRHITKKGKFYGEDSRTLTSEGRVVDMLTSFYYMRSLPYEHWEKNHSDKLTIFSGKQKETLTIKYCGLEKIDYNGTHIETYHIKFSFTTKGGTKSSDDMDAWISADEKRLPIRLEGKLPVGKIHCLLASSF